MISQPQMTLLGTAILIAVDIPMLLIHSCSTSLFPLAPLPILYNAYHHGNMVAHLQL